MTRRKRARTGRPPLGPDKAKPITVLLRPEVRAVIDGLRGEQPIADWVRVAAQRRATRDAAAARRAARRRGTSPAAELGADQPGVHVAGAARRPEPEE